MKYLLKAWPELKAKIAAAPGCILFLDFDGTLSALAPTPARAVLLKKNKRILQKISRLIPTAVISGRSLADIKRKVDIKELFYAGNHGLEWQIDSKREKIKIPAKTIAAVNWLDKQLNNLCGSYPGALLENKGLGLAMHYRLVNPHLVNPLLKEARRIITPFQKKRLLKITASNKTLDIRPVLSWNKGYWVKFLRQKFGRRLLPIYLGDDITDEDVFKTLRIGITIKVGKSRISKAKYYCDNIKQVSLFLNWLIKEVLAASAQ